MSVIIQNMGASQKDRKYFIYEIRISQEVITRCAHKRDAGLAKLLRVAADAVEYREKVNLKFRIPTFFDLEKEIDVANTEDSEVP